LTAIGPCSLCAEVYEVKRRVAPQSTRRKNGQANICLGRALGGKRGGGRSLPAARLDEYGSSWAYRQELGITPVEPLPPTQDYQ
jgi:hypothetical protein